MRIPIAIGLLVAMLCSHFGFGDSQQLAPQSLYYEFMTPHIINRYATYVDSAHTLSAAQLTFNAGPVDQALLLRVPLISAGELSRRLPLTVKIVVGLDTIIGRASDSDISYGITDGVNFHGFEYDDQGNYGQNAPCYGEEGKAGATLTESVTGTSTPAHSGKLYPGQAVITLKPAEQWGSCYTTHDGGFLNYMQYKSHLDLTRGISLEVYKSDKGETAGIKYIEVTVIRSN